MNLPALPPDSHREPERRPDAAVLRHLRRHLAKDRAPWLVPFYTKRRISLRVRSFESTHLKVNDKEGNPIEIVVVVCGERAAQPIVNTGTIYQ